MNEEKIDKIIELLTEIRDELKEVNSECSSIHFETMYISDVKNMAEDILEEIKNSFQKNKVRAHPG